MQNAFAEKRVQFDFEIDFSNGGGIQGQDFRLDIEGHPFLTEAAAVYLKDQRAALVGIDSLNIDDTLQSYPSGSYDSLKRGHSHRRTSLQSR